MGCDVNRGEGLTRTIEAGLVAVLVLAPLPLGSARPLPTFVLALIVAALMVVSLPTRAAADVLRGLGMRGPAALFALVVVYVILQCATFSPAAWHHPGWAIMANELGAAVEGSIALDRDAAVDGLIKWLTSAGLLYLACLIGRDAAAARRLTLAVALAGALWATFGLVVYWSGNASVAWFTKWTYVTDLTGPFVNRNSFATYLALSVLAMLAIAIVRIETPPPGQHTPEGPVAAVVGQFWALSCLFVLATALSLTHSRGGVAVGVIGAVVLVVSAGRRGTIKPVIAFVAIAAIVFVAAAVLISGDRLIDRLGESFDRPDGRVVIHAATLAAIAEYPVFGIGLGSFPAEFPAYRTTDLPTGEVAKAHSDVLELVLELGIPAALALFSAMIWPVIIAVRGIVVRRRDVIYPGLGVAASVAVGLHSTVDFSLQIPAVASAYMVLLGVGVAQSRSTRAPRY